jgi:Zinc finger, C3HC4 type (RING finger)
MEGLPKIDEQFLFTNSINGFGFQYEPTLKRLYVAYISEEEDGKIFNESLFTERINRKDVWITDYLGYEFVTVSQESYHQITDIINQILSLRYRLTTQTCVKTQFLPGEVFSRANFELKLIESVHLNLSMIETIPQIRDKWSYLKQILNLRPLKYDFNWFTDEGKRFCAELRKNLKCKKDRTKCFNHFRQEIIAKKPKIEEEEEECMICMASPADTMVLPCEHKVVCSTCSEKLKTTGDNRICTQCRRGIQMVVHVKTGEIEEK